MNAIGGNDMFLASVIAHDCIMVTNNVRLLKSSNLN